ncbi:glycoside hydrolase family 61 protein [Exserohilum turcica Et28A]|uniref:AA9 family lytic polysaccharide monooxygenase n=1 Tax=Exserohilum turcicum (strain 28A) TaxID=671987 RepID=R0JSQ0_EXST2|nr:glycoside hydrolase family 61 protein [Exserohilum turcica Et28A]EOA84098.1 glycoside hydrolase family 61 protein [Exserohilum turcica Et28A]
MKTGSFLSLLAAPLAVDAHYIFNLVTNKGQTVGGEYAYARKNTNSYQPSYAKDIVNSPDLRCNQGAKPGNTGTYTVKAGDTIGFKLFFNEKIEHPGPGFVYVSKAPGKVADYDGSGEWTKVVELGLTNPSTPGVDTAWATWQKDQIEWTIQEQIPKGEYLVRVEHIAIHEGHVGKAQFYMECFQLNIESSGAGTLGPTVKIPGLYSAEDPGIAFNKWSNPTSYPMPGPKLWNPSGGSGASGSSTPSSSTPSSGQPASNPASSPAAENEQAASSPNGQSGQPAGSPNGQNGQPGGNPNGNGQSGSSPYGNWGQPAGNSPYGRRTSH